MAGGCILGRVRGWGGGGGERIGVGVEGEVASVRKREGRDVWEAGQFGIESEGCL